MIVRELAPKPGARLGSAVEVWRAMAELRAQANQDRRERLWVLALDVKLRLIEEPWLVSIGTLNGSYAHPREVFRAAVIVSAFTIILCHNHPSGDPAPSPQDFAITQRLIASGEVLGIPLQDHVILGDMWYSFRETMPQLWPQPQS